METGVLEDLGFTKPEIRVYFALLEAGETTIGPLAKHAKVTPAKTYQILERLKEKGLVTSIIKSGTHHFQSFAPDALLHFLDEKRQLISQQENDLRRLLPALVARQRAAATNAAQVYEGIGGMKSLYEEAIAYLQKNKEDFIGFTLGDEYKDERANRFFKQYDAKRIALGIVVRLIGPEYQRPFQERMYRKKQPITVRYVSHPVPTGAIIFGDKVATLVWQPEPVAFCIQSAQVAKAYREFFEYLWKNAKR